MIYQYVGMRREIPESGFFVINVTLLPFLTLASQSQFIAVVVVSCFDNDFLKIHEFLFSSFIYRSISQFL